MSYDFSTLSDKDLEELVRDILSLKLGIEFQSFKPGKDKGIDLRYASNNDENEIVVQVKHYLNSGLTKLKGVLKKQEVPNVISLNPKRYVFATSLPLSHQNKEEIKIIFAPYIQSTSDVLGKNDLNNFLRNNPTVVENHFKLWLTSTTVLKRILLNGVKGRSDFTKKFIHDRIRIFVPSSTYKTAVNILNENNFILITGAPGIGKTTLANMLTYQLLGEGFELVYVREIKEAEDSYSSDKKQIFYFDDFLGSSTLDLKSSKNADLAIVSFTERVRTDKQKKLILTCRTTLLKQAKEESEKIESSKIEISKYEVKIEDYQDLDKARILYHHIYFSNLSEELKSVFFRDRFYWKIIRHRNYNPRIVEFFTDIDRLQPEIEYDEEILGFLENPTKIWEKSYKKQISNEARFFLSALYSLSGRYIVSEVTLKKAFDARLNYEVSHNNYTKASGIFNKAVKELLDGFISRILKIEENNTSIEYRFFNPSVEDFLYYYFTENVEEYFIILESAIMFRQFKERISTRKELLSKRIYFGDNYNYKTLLQLFLDKSPVLSELASDDNKLHIVSVLLKFFRWEDVEQKVINIMNDLDLIFLSWNDRDNLIEILNYIADNNIIHKFDFSIEDNLLILSQGIYYYNHIESLATLILRHEVYRSVIIKLKDSGDDNDFYYNFEENINKSWKECVEDYINQTINLKAITNRADLVNLVENRKREAIKINESLLLNPSAAIQEYLFDYDAQLEKNLSAQLKQDTLIKGINNPSNEVDEVLAINRLFNHDSTDDFKELPF